MTCPIEGITETTIAERVRDLAYTAAPLVTEQVISTVAIKVPDVNVGVAANAMPTERSICGPVLAIETVVGARVVDGDRADIAFVTTNVRAPIAVKITGE